MTSQFRLALDALRRGIFHHREDVKLRHAVSAERFVVSAEEGIGIDCAGVPALDRRGWELDEPLVCRVEREICELFPVEKQVLNIKPEAISAAIERLRSSREVL